MIKKIAKTIMDAIKMYEDSYNKEIGRCTIPEDVAFFKAAEANELPNGLWFVLGLANHWTNDLQDWCNAILTDKSTYDFCNLTHMNIEFMENKKRLQKNENKNMNGGRS